MLYNGKIYKVNKITNGFKALYDLKLQENLSMVYSPLKTFLLGLIELDPDEKNTAITAFIQAKRDVEYPEIYQLMVANSVEICKFVVENLIENFDVEITGENCRDILSGIDLHNNDPELEKILEIRHLQKVKEAE